MGEKIVIVPYDMDKDIPEVEVEVKKKKKISRENLKSAVDVKIDIPTPDATVKRKKKKEPIVDEEIKNPLFVATLKEEKKEVSPPVEEEEEEEEVKVVEQPKKKLSKSGLKPTVKIKAVFEPEEKTPRRKRKEPVVEDGPAEKISLFDEIPPIPEIPAKEKVSDHFPDKEKPLPIEESIVIVPTAISEVESAPDDKSKINDHFQERNKEPKPDEKILITARVLPEKPE